MGGAPNPALAYHEYLGPAMFVPMSALTLAAAKPQAGERVLDVACGSGIVTVQLPPLVGGTGKVVGLDINPAMLAVAAAQPPPDGPQIQWLQGNALAMDVPSASFDLVLCQHGLQFFPDKAAGAGEFRRVLAPGGRAVVACWQGLAQQTFFATLMRSLARNLGVSEAQAGVPFSFGDATALRDLLANAGFTRVEMHSNVVDAKFPQPEKFIRMTAGAGAAVMPEIYANIDMEQLVRKMTDDCAEELARFRDGDLLRFPLPTNLAIAYV
jgi:ubiquinone/menaquinone biosynthesis C-methylase UbiE